MAILVRGRIGDKVGRMTPQGNITEFSIPTPLVQVSKTTTETGGQSKGLDN